MKTRIQITMMVLCMMVAGELQGQFDGATEGLRKRRQGNELLGNLNLRNGTTVEVGLDGVLRVVTGGTLRVSGTADFSGATVSGLAAALADGDKGDITVSASGATWTIDNGVVTASKLASTLDLSAFTLTLPSNVTRLGNSIDLGTSEVTGTLPWSSVGSRPTTLSGYGITDANPLPASPTVGDYYGLRHLRGAGTSWVPLTGTDPNDFVTYQQVLSATRTGIILPAWDDESPGLTTLRSADHAGLVDVRLPAVSGTLALLDDIPASIADGATLETGLTFPFSGFAMRDEDDPHVTWLEMTGSNTDSRSLLIDVNNAQRNVFLSGNLTVSAAATISGTNTGDMPPAGTGSELQFRSSGSALGAVTRSSVSGSAITLGDAEAMGVTSTPLMTLRNTTAAAAGAQQVSPSLVLEGRGWRTNATAQSQTVRFRQNVLPVQGAASPTATWRLQSEVNGDGTWGDRLLVPSTGPSVVRGGLNIVHFGSSLQILDDDGVTVRARCDIGRWFGRDFSTNTNTESLGRDAIGGVGLGMGVPIAWSSASQWWGGTYDVQLQRGAEGVLQLLGSGTNGGSLELREQTAPAAPAADRARIWIEDNGSGKTRLMIRFATGAAQQIAIEP
jgi:hypothetical protein